MSRKLTALMMGLLILTIVPLGWGQTVWEGRIADGDDDIEEHVPAGNMDIGSSDLEMPFEDAGPSDAQIVGLRFLDVTVPKGSAIVNADQYPVFWHVFRGCQYSHPGQSQRC